jgi:hypothetical protein
VSYVTFCLTAQASKVRSHDGFGNYWVLDVTPGTASVAPVYFACHDAPGMGFSWGRYGPRTQIRPHGDLPILAYAAPPKRSLWARLTGG